MNYIKKLEIEVEDLKSELRRIRTNEERLISFLNGPKFHKDTTVQVSDIINIIRENRNNSLTMPYDYSTELKPFRITDIGQNESQEFSSLNQIQYSVLTYDSRKLYDLAEQCLIKGETVYAENGDIICRLITPREDVRSF